MKLACFFDSWVYEFLAVIAISLATNLVSGQLSEPDHPFASLKLVVLLLVFGVFALAFSHDLRQQENIYDRHTRNQMGVSIAPHDWKRRELGPRWQVQLKLLIMLFSFLATGFVIWQMFHNIHARHSSSVASPTVSIDGNQAQDLSLKELHQHDGKR